MTFAECAIIGRQHGALQKHSGKDCMLFRFQFDTEMAWQAYMTGFYRGAGYAGSANKSIRKHRCGA